MSQRKKDAAASTADALVCRFAEVSIATDGTLDGLDGRVLGGHRVDAAKHRIHGAQLVHDGEALARAR